MIKKIVSSCAVISLLIAFAMPLAFASGFAKEGNESAPRIVHSYYKEKVVQYRWPEGVRPSVSALPQYYYYEEAYMGGTAKGTLWYKSHYQPADGDSMFYITYGGTMTIVI